MCKAIPSVVTPHLLFIRLPACLPACLPALLHCCVASSHALCRCIMLLCDTVQCIFALDAAITTTTAAAAAAADKD